MPVYTRRGDKGITSIIAPDGSEKKVRKNSKIIEAIGTLDELNSFLGVLKWRPTDNRGFFWHWTTRIQKEILAISTTLGGDEVPLDKKVIAEMEKQIERMDGRLFPLKNPVYPAPTELAAFCHYTRALTRRAERKLAAVDEETPLRPDILEFVNRLSDYFFVLARYVAYKTGFRHTSWLAGKMRKKDREYEKLHEQKPM